MRLVQARPGGIERGLDPALDRSARGARVFRAAARARVRSSGTRRNQARGPRSAPAVGGRALRASSALRSATPRVQHGPGVHAPERRHDAGPWGHAGGALSHAERRKGDEDLGCGACRPHPLPSARALEQAARVLCPTVGTLRSPPRPRGHEPPWPVVSRELPMATQLLRVAARPAPHRSMAVRRADV